MLVAVLAVNKLACAVGTVVGVVLLNSYVVSKLSAALVLLVFMLVPPGFVGIAELRASRGASILESRKRCQSVFLRQRYFGWCLYFHAFPLVYCHDRYCVS